MREDFKPEVIIGSVVAANPGKPKENDLMSQLENMIMLEDGLYSSGFFRHYYDIQV